MWVNGKRLPRMERVQQIADYLGIETTDLLEENNSQKIPWEDNVKPIKISDKFIKIPVLGSVPAGVPVEANKPKTHTFGAGKYTCGKGFEPGTYDLIALSGSGNVFCDDEGLNEILGTDSDYATPSYNGETFVDGDVLEIQDNLQLKLEP